MVNLEQVRLLETKVAKAIDYVKRLSEENTLLRGKLDGYKNRIDELEVLVQSFKEDQVRIEAGIISALEKLNQFEDVMDLDAEQTQDTDTDNSEASEPDITAPVTPSIQDSDDPESDEAILASLEAEEAALKKDIPKENNETTDSLPVQSEETEDKPGTAELDIF